MISLDGAGSDYTIAEGTGGSDSLESKDNTVTSATQPRVSIAAASALATQVDAGEDVEFTITASDTPSGTITVNYNVSETGNFVADGNDTIDLVTSGTTTTLTLTATDSAPTTEEGVSTITVTLLEGANYSLANPNGHIATTTATDIPLLPELTVTGVTATEGQTGLSIGFSLNRNAGADGVSIAYEIAANNSATLTSDYTLADSPVAIAAGSRHGFTCCYSIR